MCEPGLLAGLLFRYRKCIGITYNVLFVLYEKSLMKFLMKNLDNYAPSSLRGRILKFGLISIKKILKTNVVDVKKLAAN